MIDEEFTIDLNLVDYCENPEYNFEMKPQYFNSVQYLLREPKKSYFFSIDDLVI